MIRKLEVENKETYIAFVNDHDNENENDPALVAPPQNFVNFLGELKKRETQPREGFVPVTRYFIFLESKIAGYIDCRWDLTESTLQYGGHIGYNVAPSFRGKGISHKLLAFGIEQYQKRDFEKILLTVDADNLASKKTIEKKGGILENSFHIEGKEHCRYWIDVTSGNSCI